MPAPQEPIDRRAIPPAARESTFALADGHAIRRIDWPGADGGQRGSILFLPGRGDFYEKYLGLLEHQGDKSNYDLQANQDIAKNLKGKLLLAHGMLDDNVPVSSTLLVVDALEQANKDFDLVLFPRAHHGYGDQSFYMMRRRWDYFVANLMGATPPKEFRIERSAN